MASPPAQMHKRDAEGPSSPFLAMSECGVLTDRKHLTDDWGKTTCRNCCHCEEYREHLRREGFRAGLVAAADAVLARCEPHAPLSRKILMGAIEAIEEIPED